MIKPNTINNEYGQTTANDDEVCDVAEFAYNGGPIDWTYWQDRKATPHQAAKLANCIDPITWPGNEYEQGTIPKAMQEKIQRLEEWLAERSDQWALSALVDALGTDAVPYSMKQAVIYGKQKQEKDEPPATVVASEPPGKMPNVASGKLAIKAAWQLECESNRAAIADAVMARLQEWADAGDEPETLIASKKSKRGVKWRTKAGKERLYDVEACGKTLTNWMKSRA